MGWTDERVELLKKLWNEGLSASQIAGRLGGVTRNAVIGKVHRLGLSGRVTPTRTLGTRRPRTRTATAPRRVVRPRTVAPAGQTRPQWGWEPTIQPEGLPEVAELRLPSELTQLAPGQEWRTVWDSAISREEFGGQIRARFEGTVYYGDAPAGGKRREFDAAVVLDWATLQPVQRLELMTTHDLAKREKQKLELLRSVLTYFHYASKETRPEVFRAEIDRMNRAVRETQDRWRTRQSDETTELDFPWIPSETSNGRHHSSPAL